MLEWYLDPVADRFFTRVMDLLVTPPAPLPQVTLGERAVSERMKVPLGNAFTSALHRDLDERMKRLHRTSASYKVNWNTVAMRVSWCCRHAVEHTLVTMNVDVPVCEPGEPRIIAIERLDKLDGAAEIIEESVNVESAEFKMGDRAALVGAQQITHALIRTRMQTTAALRQLLRQSKECLLTKKLTYGVRVGDCFFNFWAAYGTSTDGLVTIAEELGKVFE